MQLLQLRKESLKKVRLVQDKLDFFFRDCKSCIYNCDDLLWYFYSYNNSSYVETTSKNFVKNYQSMSFLGQMSKSNWTSLCEKKKPDLARAKSEAPVYAF